MTTTTPTPKKKDSQAKVVKLTEAQLRKFIQGQVKGLNEIMMTPTPSSSPILQDYRKRLKLGYEPLQKARTMIERIPEFSHQAAKLSQILSDLVALFKETQAEPDVSERPTIPPVPQSRSL